MIHLLQFVHRAKTGMLTAEKDNTLQMKGNSGIMLQSRYEVQILDCEDNPTYVNGMVGSIYKRSASLVNAFTKTNERQ